MYQGFFRFLLCHIVIVFHFASTGPMPGRIAVFAFYVVSGYLITRVVNERYVGAMGLVRFGINRFLRLFPTYFIVMLMGLVILGAADGRAIAGGFEEFTIPTTIDSWSRQFAIVGLTQFSGGLYPERLVPPAFSLAIELVHYALIALFVGRSRYLTSTWWVVGSVISANYTFTNDFKGAFLTYWGPTIAFSSGAMLYHYRRQFNQIVPSTYHSGMYALTFSLMLVVYCFLPAGLAAMEILSGGDVSTVKARYSHPSVLMLYGSVVITLTALHFCEAPACREGKESSIDVRLKKYATYCGDLSYPMFLSHLTIFAALKLLVPNLPHLATCVSAIILSYGFSICVVNCVERPIEKTRTRIRTVTECR